MEHLAKINVPLYIRNKRARKEERRTHRLWRAQQRQAREQEAVNAEFGPESKVVAMLAKNGKAASAVDISKGRVRFVAPEVFSVMEDPQGTISALRDLAAQIKSMPKIRSVQLNLHRVKKYDLGANALLDVLVDEVEVKRKQTRRKIRWSGSYPADLEQRRLVRSLGVIKFLEVAQEYVSADEASRIEAFHDRAKHYVRAIRPREADKKSRVTQRFADHINKCLRHILRELTPTARKKLCDYVGEILDNAEEHAQMFDWTIQGYLDTTAEGLICELVIFNFGRTIADSFQALPPAPHGYTRTMVQPYLDAHSKKGFFSSGWCEADLLTLIALQGGVSSKNFSEADTRGNGTVDLITFFQKVAAECQREDGAKTRARMTLVSGSTGIFFDGKYEMVSTDQKPGIIAFNAENDLRTRPDPEYVRHFSTADFPGTILSIKFSMSPESTATSTAPDRDSK
jgi:hypothetical protein